jgi:hypothetical protein
VFWEQSQLRRIEDFDAGFASDQYLAVRIEHDDPIDAAAEDEVQRFAPRTRLSATIEELRRRVTAQPGVRAVTFTERVPTTGRPQKVIEVGYDRNTASPAEGTNAAAPLRRAAVAAVEPSYFEALDAPILAGRAFTAADAVAGTRVAIVDQSFVEQVLQGRNAVGQQVRFRYPGPPERRWGPGNADDPAEPGDWYEVIGVVRELGVGAPTQPGRAAGFYIPVTADLFDQIHMMVHVRGGDPMTLAPQLRDLASAVDPAMRLVTLQRGNDVNHDVVWTSRFWIRVTTVVSGVALVLSLAGIYAVLSFTVARRTREIGLRVALGASRPRIVAATFRRPLLQVTGGIMAGTAVVFTFAALLKYTEFPGSETPLTIQDTTMIVVYGIVMLGVCMLACLVPTRRALNIEPTIALRAD